MSSLFVLPLLLVAAPPRVLSLEEALTLAEKNRPLVAAAIANLRSADARVDVASAPLWPSLNGSGVYTQQTGNFVARPGALPATLNQQPRGNSFDTFGFWNFSLNASWTAWDFGVVRSNRAAAEATRSGLEATREATLSDVQLAVRSAYFAAWAQRALVKVAQESVTVLERHVEQAATMVRVGTKPELDLAQARADRASARLNLVNAENAERQALANLVQVLGLTEDEDLAVQEDSPAPIAGEEGAAPALVETAVGARPELKALDAQLAALVEQHSATWAGFFPSLGLGLGFTDQGTNLDGLTWNLNGQVTLSWAIFSGLSTVASLRENEAQQLVAAANKAERDLEIRAEVRSAHLAVRAAKASSVAAGELDVAARERLRLAEGRYAAGAGTIIELEDAQVAAASAAAQVVQGRYQLALARAQLLHALGGR